MSCSGTCDAMQGGAGLYVSSFSMSVSVFPGVAAGSHWSTRTRCCYPAGHYT